MAGFGEPSTAFALKAGAQDVGLIGVDEPRLYMQHSAIADYQMDCSDVLPTTQTTQRFTFKTEKNADHFERLWLVFTVLLTTTGGTYKRLCDGFGLNCIDHIDLRNGTTLVQTIYPATETYARITKNLLFEKQQDIFPMVGLGYTTAERNSLAAGTNTQTFHVPVEFFWRDDVTKDVIVPAVANGFIIDVYLKDPSLVVETDGAVPALPTTILTFTNVALREELVFTDEETRELKVSQTTGGASINYFYDERCAIPPVVIPSGTTKTAPISLQGLNGPMKEMFVFVTPNSSVTTPYGNKAYDYSWAYNPNYLELKSNQNTLVRPFDLQKFMAPVADSRYHTGGPVPYIFLNFSQMPEATNVASGHLQLQYASNPTLTLTWNTATPVDYQVTIEGRYYNWVQHTDGSMRRVFQP